MKFIKRYFNKKIVLKFILWFIAMIAEKTFDEVEVRTQSLKPLNRACADPTYWNHSWPIPNNQIIFILS